MKRRQHEERVVRIIAAIEGEKVPVSEVSVPRARLPIDLVMTLGVPSGAWGPIRWTLAHRRVCVEHYSGSPGIASLSRSLAKHAFVVEEWWSAFKSSLVRDRVKALASREPVLISLPPPMGANDGSVDLAGEPRPGDGRTDDGRTDDGRTDGARTDEARIDDGRTGAAQTDEARIDDGRTGAAQTDEARAGEAQDDETRAGEARAGEARAGGSQATAHLEIHPPALLLLSAGYPRQALSGRLDLPATECPGICHCHRPLLGDIILVHIRGLPLDAPGCALLRFMATPTSPEEARRLIAGLLNDRTVLDSERNRLMEQAMDGIIPTTTSEKGSILDRIRAEMRQEMQEEMRQEMRQEMQEEVQQKVQEKVDESLATFASSVLKVLEARGIQVKPAEKKRIRGCRDLKVLKAWHDRSLQVSSASELFK